MKIASFGLSVLFVFTGACWGQETGLDGFTESKQVKLVAIPTTVLKGKDVQVFGKVTQGKKNASDVDVTLLKDANVRQGNAFVFANPCSTDENGIVRWLSKPISDGNAKLTADANGFPRSNEVTITVVNALWIENEKYTGFDLCGSNVWDIKGAPSVFVGSGKTTNAAKLVFNPPTHAASGHTFTAGCLR